MIDNRQSIRLSDLDASHGAAGLTCRHCGCRDFRVVYTRPIAGGIRRRRECRHCGHRITTTERSQ